MVIYAVSRGLDTKVHFLEPIVKDVFTSFLSNILSSLKTEMLMKDDFKPSFPEGQTKWDYANCVGDELKKACGKYPDICTYKKYYNYSAEFLRSLTVMFFEDECWSTKCAHHEKWHSLIGIAAEGQTYKVYFCEYFKSGQP